jgi:uridine kinase
MNSLLILIAGGSASGKSTMAMEITRRLTGHDSLILSQDNYYRDVSHLSQSELAGYNFDHPASIDDELLSRSVASLIQGGSVAIPEYDFITHRSMPGTALQHARDIVIVEGIFVLYYHQLAEMADLKVYVDTDADQRLLRRIRRDTEQRGFSVKAVLDQYESTVKPMHDAFIEPQKKLADIIIPGINNFEKPIAMIEGFILRRLIEQAGHAGR